MSHAELDPDEQAKSGITPGLLRLSVGIEDLSDLRQDFQQALEKLSDFEGKTKHEKIS